MDTWDVLLVPCGLKFELNRIIKKSINILGKLDENQKNSENPKNFFIFQHLPIFFSNLRGTLPGQSITIQSWVNRQVRDGVST